VATKPARRLLYALIAPLPLPLRRGIDRRVRGLAESRKLVRADAVVVSHPKSGRTWLRALLSWYWRTARGLATEALLGFDDYHRLDPTVPRILFTHDNYPVDWLGPARLEALYAARPLVLLTRDPRDVVVSAFFQTRRRTDPAKRRILGKDDPALADLSGFLRHPEWGLPRILAFYERWAERLPRLPRALRVRYEDLRRDPAGVFTRVLIHLGETPVDAGAVARAVAETEFSRMRERERRGELATGRSRRFSAGGDDPAALKVREGRIGGFRDHLRAGDIAWMEAEIARRMPPGFGYRAEETDPSSGSG